MQADGFALGGVAGVAVGPGLVGGALQVVPAGIEDLPDFVTQFREELLGGFLLIALRSVGSAVAGVERVDGGDFGGCYAFQNGRGRGVVGGGHD